MNKLCGCAYAHYAHSPNCERTLCDDTAITRICLASARILRSGISSYMISLKNDLSTRIRPAFHPMIYGPLNWIGGAEHAGASPRRETGSAKPSIPGASACRGHQALIFWQVKQFVSGNHAQEAGWMIARVAQRARLLRRKW